MVLTKDRLGQYENPRIFTGTTQKTVNSATGSGIFIHISANAPNPVKYTDPDGREDACVNEIFYNKLNSSLDTNVPLSPPNVDIDANIAQAKSMRFISYLIPIIGLLIKYIWFYTMVKDYGPWDYKRMGENLEYEDFGNFHYGIVGSAAGIPKPILLRAAGLAQRHGKRSKPEWGRWYNWIFFAPYGDDPRDQIQIKKGITYYYKKRK